MSIRFDRVIGDGDRDNARIRQIVDWYFQEWGMNPEAGLKRLSELPAEGTPFQVLMSVDKTPVATGGLYRHVGLLDIAPRFKIYGPWLALMFTTPENRRKGYGGMLCEEIQNQCRELGLKKIFLFTHTAESFYARLGWNVVEKVQVKERNVAVMHKDL
jgi:GNAT superfamily N-acetyltransferase